jgi:hypothetical protein
MVIKGRIIALMALFLFVVFFIAATIIPPKLLAEMVRVVHLSVVVAVLVSYGRIGFLAMFKRVQSGHDILAMGIVFSFSSHFLYGVWMLVWRLSGQPPWIINSDVTAFLVALSTVAGLCYLAAPGSIDGHVPPRNRLLIGSAFGCAFLLVAFSVLHPLDLGPLADALKPWLTDDDGSFDYGRAMLHDLLRNLG